MKDLYITGGKISNFLNSSEYNQILVIIIDEETRDLIKAKNKNKRIKKNNGKGRKNGMLEKNVDVIRQWRIENKIK